MFAGPECRLDSLYLITGTHINMEGENELHRGASVFHMCSVPCFLCIHVYNTHTHTHKFIVVVEVVINITKIVRIKLPFSCAYFINQGIGTK